MEMARMCGSWTHSRIFVSQIDQIGEIWVRRSSVAFGMHDSIREIVALIQEISRSHKNSALLFQVYANLLRSELAAFTQAPLG